MLAIGIAAGAQAQVTVTPTTPGYTGSSTDLFDISNGSSIVSSTPTQDGGGIGVTVYPAINAIGGNAGFGGDAGNTVFADGSGATESFIFKTLSAVTISGVDLLLAADEFRAFRNVALFGGNDGVVFNQLFSYDLGTGLYATTYGSAGITVAARFDPVSYSYFRFDGVPTSSGPFNGGRLIELDAIPGTIAAAIPEPASWAMMIVGVGLIGAGLRYRQRRTVLRFA
ncbi:PEPxxWA-CTERM sorting domain-containing protein [Sphingomonas bacterium]|uniref:PEPxxWA-CTERM sorting domain-containing protein n=1 Tax=Sphingomonas bacterium TaxID=1895847 RepID=UPI001576E992|nr:PEPxxWA-CTERM sorting domain-containing protein [Sphingomonas bacterium]